MQARKKMAKVSTIDKFCTSDILKNGWDRGGIERPRLSTFGGPE